MRINYNVSSIIAKNALNNNDSRLSISTQKLSSGYKINSAKDDAAGLAIARKMNMQIRALERANQNANDGLSVVDTADGAMSEMHSILQRMNELSVQSANGTNSDSDRSQIQLEIDQLVDELDRIADTTQFNAQNLLDGSFAYKGYTNTDYVKVMSNSDDVSMGTYTINLSGEELLDAVTKYNENTKIAKEEAKKVTEEAEANGTTATPSAAQTAAETAAATALSDIKNALVPVSGTVVGFPTDATVSITDDDVTISSTDGFEIKIAVNDVSSYVLNNSAATANADIKNANGTTKEDRNIEINITKMGPMVIQTGANEGQQLDIEIPAVYAKNLGVDGLSVSTEDDATDAIDTVANAINQLSSIRSKIGAYANRLEHTITNLNTTQESMTESYSRIMDTDMAEEMTEYTTAQVLVQAATSVLSQANERPQQVLQLLQ